MYKIKQKPEDFIVKEINELKFDEKGQYSYYLLKKRNYNTVDAIKKICDKWKIRKKYVNFAGTKDKVAVTEQYISISRGPSKELILKDLELKFLGKGKERLNLGSLKGNKFEIVVRNIEKKPRPVKKVINYFDEQRFGRDKNNHIIGKHILKGDYKKACELIGVKAKGNDFIGAFRSIPRKTFI